MDGSNLLNKEMRRKTFKSMSSLERQKLILKKMKDKGIEVGSGVPNKIYNSDEVYELIKIVSCLPELREKTKKQINKKAWHSTTDTKK